MNHSIYSADRTTHLKIVAMALLVAIAVTGFAVSSHVSSDAGTLVVVKAGKPVMVTSLGTPLAR